MSMAFIAIDFQKKFLSNLRFPLNFTMASKARRFANILSYYDVETIWVGMEPSNNKWEIIDGNAPNKDQMVRKLGLKSIAPTKKESLLIKPWESAFHPASDGVLKTYLESKGIKHILVGGINTSACVLSSLSHALQHTKMEVTAVYDLMGDNNDPFGLLPHTLIKRQQAKLIDMNEYSRRKATLKTSNEVCETLPELTSKPPLNIHRYIRAQIFRMAI